MRTRSVNGRSWQRADLVGPQAKYSWTLWEFLWEVDYPGDYELMARAISSSGEVHDQTLAPGLTPVLTGKSTCAVLRRPETTASTPAVPSTQASKDLGF